VIAADIVGQQSDERSFKCNVIPDDAKRRSGMT
jgi:hypothetical protein